MTFVLVHGAFGTPTELAPVIPWLEALGHRAIAVDLPCANPAATLDDYALAVVGARIEGPVVVVGHSAGGATIALVPGRTRVERLVHVTAVVPEPGRSILDVVGAGVRETMLSVSRHDGNGCRSFDLPHLRALHRGQDHTAPEAARDGSAPGRGPNQDRLRAFGLRPPAPRARRGVSGAGPIHVSSQEGILGPSSSSS